MTNRLLILSMFAAMSTASIHAQEPLKLKLNIPFSFHVGKSAMPAGMYTLQNGKTAKGILTVRADSGAGTINIGTIPDYPSNPPAAGKLVFHKYGEEYFLYQVWTPGSDRVARLHESPREADLVAKGKNPDETVLTAGRR